MSARLIIRSNRHCGGTAPACDGRGMPWNRLFDAFTNGLGWRKLCGSCSDPERRHPTKAYRGPYPIRTPKPYLHIVDGGQGE